MSYAYRALSPTLYETADAAVAWFIREWGVHKSRIRVEDEIDPDIRFRPTFIAQLNDGHLLCIEVLQSIYVPTLDSVALACLRKGLPVKLYTAVPKDLQDPEYSRNLKSAKMAGVGVLEVNRRSGEIVLTALSLSLAALRPLKLTDFAKKYRQNLRHADQTFRDGEPSKACSLVYDELESCFRVFVKKCVTKRVWKNQNKLNLDTVAWARLVDEVDRTLKRKNPLARPVSSALLARIKGVTTYRNESGHKPKNLSDRDRALRTRFEGAIDLLREFLDAVRGFRI